MSASHRSLQEKSSARLAAAQMLYQAALTGGRAEPERMLADYRAYLEDNRASPAEATLPAVPPNFAYLRRLLEGVVAHAETLESWVERLLTADWRKERMSPLLLSILRLGVFELLHFRELKPAIIINEYVTLTGRFFGQGETDFVNAALNSAAAQIREVS